MDNPSWDQSIFEDTLRLYFRRISEEKIPRSLNKKMFFVALRAQSETEKVAAGRVVFELNRPVLAKRGGSISANSPLGPVEIPIGIAIAAKRAKKLWTVEAKEKAAKGRRRKGVTSSQRAWRKLIQQKLEKMTGGRERSVGFLRLGWLSVVKKLSPLVKDKSGAPSGDSSLKAPRDPKGDIIPATASNHSVTGINMAKAKSEHLGGFERIGQEGAQRAFAAETADMIQYLEREALKEETERFNAANRR